ncbi:MAG: MYXO-CTERM sorting domain-containing protein, partial [Myxococcota bacterium]
QQFYNRLEDYRDYLDADNFDAQAFADELEESVVEPLRHAQDLFDNRPYLTRMYTTLSAEEMSRDPVFAYNSDMANVDNIRTATATAMCDDTNNPEGTVLTVTLSDGRAITATIDPNWNVVFDNSAEPAAAVIEETGPTGSMPVVIYDTALGIDNLDAVLDERQRENHANRPDMVAMPTPTSGGDGGGCAVTPGSSAPMASLLVLALGLIGFHRRRR